MLWAFIQGKTELRADNISPERLLFLCAKQNIRVWDVRPEEDFIRLCMAPEDWEKIKPLLTGAGARTEARLRGFPAILLRLRERTAFLFGLPLVLVLLCLSGLFIWDIRIEGCDRVNPAEVRDALEECGVHFGTPGIAVREKELQNALLLKLPDVHWLAVNLRGCVARVQITEEPEREPETPAGANIVADRDGVLTSFEVFSGTPAVNKGDAVRKGQVLVWGYEQNTENKVPPRAYIRGRSLVVLSARMSKTRQMIVQTEDAEGGTWVLFGKNAGKIAHIGSNFTRKYVTITEEKRTSFFLSVQREYRRSFVTVSRDKTAPEAQAELYEYLHLRAEQTGGEILSEECSFTETENAYLMTLSCDTYGSLGKEETGE